MDISMFFEFPGLLITIGAVLLILSIVLLILAFKTSDNPESLEVEEPKENSVVEEIKKETKVENDKSDDKALPEETEVSPQLENTGIMDAIQNTSDEKENTTDLEEDEETEDGFDLTKVFEISEDNNVTEELPFKNYAETTSVQDEIKTDDSDDEVELL